MIVGVAGHIDHGKTALVKALTGVDADRLPAEKVRGISIDLGFAYRQRPDGGITGFVDMPGHEKFMRNMLAGASGIDLLLLVVAADDGVMPQTREHLAVAELLGVERAVIAVAKTDPLSSSHFALGLKRAGVDALAIAGAWERPVVLFVRDDGRGGTSVEARPADGLMGRTAAEAEALIRCDHGADWQVAAIGPAGESLVPFATISHDGRHAGRGGLGAVLGAKNVKAVAVGGTRRAPIADPAAAIALAKDLSARSFGPATAKYRELGTVANLLVFNRFDALPARNFEAGRFEGADRLASDDLDPARRVARKSCAACTIGCEHIYPVPNRGGADPKPARGVRMEYESLFALGPLCGVDDPARVLEAAAACDDLGLDTISTGGTIAFLMDCEAHQLIDARLPSGRLLRFGDGEALVEAIGLIPDRIGLGDLLALGSRRAAESIGGAANGLAIHVKGLELPGYDPRSLQSMALGLAVGTRGADHNRSGAYEADFSPGVDRRRGGVDSAEAAIATEDRAALIDSLILCKFLRGVFVDLYDETAPMLAAVTGWNVTGAELRTTARRIAIARRLLNQREGWTRAEDNLPARLLSNAPDTPDAEGLPAARLESMIAAYYRLRGLSTEGLVQPETIASLELATDFGSARVIVGS